MKSIFRDLKLEQLGPFLAMLVFFIYTGLLRSALDCDCKTGTRCSAYMALPPVIILLLQLWVQKTLRCPRVLREEWKSFICLPFRFYDVFKAVIVAMFWVVVVLIDGNWYLCCGRHQHDVTQLTCRDKSSLTSEEQKTIAALKSWSMDIGMSILLVMVILSIIIQHCAPCCERCCSSESLYYKALLEKEDEVLEEVMKTKVKETLKDGIEKHIWRDKWRNELLEQEQPQPEQPQSEQQQPQQEQPQPEQQQPQQPEPELQTPQTPQPEEWIPLL